MRFAHLKLTAISLTVLLFCTTNVNATIDFWNSNLTWAGQGQCSAEFTFDSGFENIQKLDVIFNLVDKTGKVVAEDSISLNAFGQYSANRYEQIFVESEEICDANLRVFVTKATATIDGKKVDLLSTKRISVRDFKPLVIRLSKP